MVGRRRCLAAFVALWGPGCPSPGASDGAPSTPAVDDAAIEPGSSGVKKAPEQAPRAAAAVPELFTLDQRLRHAVRTGDVRTARRALALGADPSATDKLGRNTLIVAAWAPRSSYDDDERAAVVELLVERGVAVDVQDHSGRTALSYAAGKGHLRVVRYLMERGAKIAVPDRRGRPPLFHAVLSRDPAVVEVLLRAGAAPNVRDRFGDTPLIAACAKGVDGAVSLLLAAGADPALRDQEGRTARDRAAPGSCRALQAAPSTE